MTDHQKIEAFGFSGDNRLWNAVHAALDESIEQEVSTMCAVTTVGESRTHAAGRAEALRQFRDLLHLLRSDALSALAPSVDDPV